MTRAPIIMIIVQIISVVLLGVSCREVYFPDDLEQKEPILSVHGILYENSQPLVKLSRTMGYYEEAENPIHNALVVVIDDAGRADTLTETGQTGVYAISASEPLGKVGMVYTLKIETEDGNIFMSNPVKMPAKPVMEDFYAELAEKTFLTYNSQGKLRNDVVRGISVFTDLAGAGDEDHYYRFRTRAVEERLLVSEYSEDEIVYNIAKTNDLYDVAKSMLFTDRQLVNRHESIFLAETERVTGVLNTNGWAYFLKFIVTHRVYAISADVYDFFLSIKEQLTSEDEIFAPVPTRIRSNIYCINNDDVRVIGVFEASSVLTLYMSCYASENYEYLFETHLESLPQDLELFFPPEYPAIKP